MKWVHFCHISLSCYWNDSGRGLSRRHFSPWNFKHTSFCTCISFSLLDVKKWVVLCHESLYANNVPVLQGVCFVAVSVCVFACLCHQAPSRDAEHVWHLMARSNRSWSTAGVKGVDVDGMRTENGCVPSLRFMNEFDWWLHWPPRMCQGDHLDPQVTLCFTLLFFTTSSLPPPPHLKL